MADRVGQQLGNYRLVRFLGQGGFGAVYLGEHLLLRTQAAIKVLDTHLTNQDVEGFLTEARARASLIHPNIVRVLDFGLEGQVPFLILEYAPNGTLRTLYHSGVPVSPTTVLPHVKQIASALQYGHIRGFIHGQVMPRNMLLNHNNEVLLDHFRFSFSAIEDEARWFMGTPYYVAPEQLHGQLFPATDQYALGLTIYEWLTGRRPFDGETAMDMILKRLNSEPPSLCAIIPTISLKIEQTVMKALAKDPQQRFPNVQDFAVSFEQACHYKPYAYDVALSFAGEDRQYADTLADALRHRGLNVFYDKYEKSTLWGKNLYTYLSDVYQNKARYCVMFLSQHYATKLWTNHEREAAQARAFSENEEYLLPVRLDDTKIPGIPPTIAYLSWPPETGETIADTIMAKLDKMP